MVREKMRRGRFGGIWMKKAKRKNAVRRPDARERSEAPRPEGLESTENAASPAAREAALTEDAARSGDSRALAGGISAEESARREDDMLPESAECGGDSTPAPPDRARGWPENEAAAEDDAPCPLIPMARMAA